MTLKKEDLKESGVKERMQGNNVKKLNVFLDIESHSYCVGTLLEERGKIFFEYDSDFNLSKNLLEDEAKYPVSLGRGSAALISFKYLLNSVH